MGILTPADFPAAAAEMAAKHTEISRIVEEFGVPDFWCRPPGFRTLLRIILEQQVSLASAREALQRIEEGIGSLSAARISESGEVTLRGLGITRQKARYAISLAEAVSSSRLSFSQLHDLSDDQARKALTSVTGIGPWTANVYLLTALGRTDIWPSGDLALEKTIDAILPGADDQLKRTGNRWRPCRSVAARILWHWYLSQPGRKTIPLA